MIEITFKTLIDSLPNLKKVSEYKYLVETRYRMAKALMCVQEEVNQYDKLHEEILRKYGDALVDGRYNIKAEKLPAYRQELAQLDAITVKLPIEKLLHTNVENQIESPVDIVALSWLIDFPELKSEDEQPQANAATT